jgi:chitin synthase
MLRTFPKRQNVFVPQAICHTVVPDDYKTLQSQRRRWINSTIHNLMELVFVKDLCGMFCFSMQFVVLLDLLGTAVLPGGLLITYYLIFSTLKNAIFNPEIYSGPEKTQLFVTLTMIFVIFMPAILVLLTSSRRSYIGWMFIYLAALPVWQFMLPIYAFWHFDDFSVHV